ncbi:MAG: branched-chain amino acid transferase [Pelagibacteraceae bacterium]|nr:branched-chain amino acid transferase [Pelagibacteraceae bacterium]
MNEIFPQGYAWIDSKYVELAEAKIPILDWGFLRSDATYDVVHVWKGRFFRLDKHIDRFFESAKKLRMPCQISRDELKKILANCVIKGKLESAYVEMIQTRGMSPKFVRDPRLATPRVMAFAVPFGWILKQEDFEKGLNVLLTDIKRIPPSSVDPTIKNYHWMDLVTGMLDAYEKGNDTAVLVDENNNITEGPGFNLFCVNGSGIFTPDHGVLEGITRQSVFDLAKELHLPIMKKSISVEELYNAEELFATSTAGGIMPITKVSGKEIGKGSVGNLTRQLHKLYWEKHTDDSWSTSISDILTN